MRAANDSGARLRPLGPGDAEEISALFSSNWSFLEPWMPRRDPSWFDVDVRRAELEREAADHDAGAAYHFAVTLGGDIIGRIDLSNVVRRVWRNANLGYWIAERHCGRGHATSAVRSVTEFAFRDAALHRLQAAVMPRNPASARVLEKAGFRREGMALRYLLIAGRWEDHVIFATTSEEWQEPA